MEEKGKKEEKEIAVERIMLVHRFSGVGVALSCCVALRFFHRPRMFTEPGVLPTTACDMKASVGRFDATAPPQAIASVATAASPAYRKSEPQPPSPTTAGEPPTNNSRQPCNLTRPELYELLDKNYGTPKYSLYFFNGTQTDGHAPLLKERFNIDSKDFYDRCKKCGMTIDEHHASMPSVVPAAADYMKNIVAHFVECVNYGKHKEALNHYRNWMTNVFRTEEGECCAPMKVKQSWGGDIWKERLIEARKDLVGLDKNETDPRAPRVLGIHAGTGSGKTHALLDAAQHLGATTAIYITYNMGQDLKLDHSDPSIASLLRILLRHPSNENMSNWSCDKAFKRCKGELRLLAEERLLDFVVSYIAEKEKNPRAAHVVIAVDEIRKLMVTSNVPVLQTTSTLGLLASMLESSGVKCTVIVSALTESAFVTMSDRLIVKVLLPQPSDEVRDFVAKELFGKQKPTERQMAMLAAACGTHFRSIVAGCQTLLCGGNLDVPTFLTAIGRRISQNMDGFETAAIRDYTQRCVSVGSRNALAQTPVVAPFLDNLGSLAPPMVCIAFEKDVGMPEFCHPVKKLFETTAFISAPKQLEHCGYHYDRFRALYRLPVVPYGVEVCNCGPLGTTSWFKELIFPEGIAYEKTLDTSSLFAVEWRGEERSEEESPLERNSAEQPKVEERRQRVVWTKHKLELEKYLFPNAEGHPRIDRACLVVHRTNNTLCLVLYQDKINADGMAAAVKGLNAAADELKDGMKIPVLCVAQVIGASVSTTAQNKFKHPYILIRDDEVSQFYTPTFAAAIRFVRQRHALRDVLSVPS